MTDATETVPLEQNVPLLKSIIAPLFQRAVAAQLEGDPATAQVMWQRIIALGGTATYIGVAAFANAAVINSVKPPAPGSCRMPGASGPESTAEQFVREFLTASVQRDDEAKTALWLAFAKPLLDDPTSAESGEQLSTALTLLTRRAAAGIEREQRRQRLTHQHPAARSARRRKAAGRR
jgi:hypothetical protein